MLECLASVNREVAENSMRTLISWAGDDPTREGQHDTPARSCAPTRNSSSATSGPGADPVVA